MGQRHIGANLEKNVQTFQLSEPFSIAKRFQKIKNSVKIDLCVLSLSDIDKP